MFGRRKHANATNSYWHRLTVRWKGKRDGGKQIPAGDDSLGSDYEKQLLERGKQHLQQIVGVYSAQIQHVEADREDHILQLRKYTKNFVEEITKYRQKKADLGRDVTIHLSRKWYLLFIALIVAGEFALNAQAFEVFHKPTLLTWIMALTVATGVPFVAHFLGVWIKQWPEPKWATSVKVFTAISVTVACLIGINIARRQYLLSQDIQIDKGADALELAFLLINIFVFLAAIIMASFAHDEDQELENLSKRTQALVQQLDRCDRKISFLGGEIDKLRQRETAEIEEVKAMIIELVFMYRDANIFARPENKRPIAFRAQPTLPEPIRGSEMQKLTPEDEVDKIRKEAHDALTAATTPSITMLKKQVAAS